MWRLTWHLALIIGAYYVVPLGEDQPGWLRALRTAAVLAGIALVARSVARGVGRGSAGWRSGRTTRGRVRGGGAGGGLCGRADDSVASWREGECAGLETRTGGPYSAVSARATVGCGGVHARGQLASGLVLAQM